MIQHSVGFQFYHLSSKKVFKSGCQKKTNEWYDDTLMTSKSSQNENAKNK